MSGDAPLLVVDTREPKGKGWEPYLTLPFIRGTIKTGDLSIAGLEQHIAIERKTLGDLVTCLSHHRPRFEEELRRAQGLDYFAVVCEGFFGDLAKGKYHSNMTTASAWESVAALMARYKVPFLMAGDTPTAAKLAQSLLLKRLREHIRLSDAVKRAA